MLGVSPMEHIRNEIIRQRSNVMDVASTISKLKWQGAGHSCRRTDKEVRKESPRVLRHIPRSSAVLIHPLPLPAMRSNHRSKGRAGVRLYVCHSPLENLSIPSVVSSAAECDQSSMPYGYPTWTMFLWQMPTSGAGTKLLSWEKKNSCYTKYVLFRLKAESRLLAHICSKFHVWIVTLFKSLRPVCIRYCFCSAFCMQELMHIAKVQ